MTRKLYYDDPYLDRFEATVMRVTPGENGPEVILDQTAFFPEAGGQPHDLGRLSDVDVVAVFENDDEEIIHVIAAGNFAVGRKVTGIVDMARRLENMRRHTGQHILSRAFIETAGIDTICANHGEIGTIELSVDELSDEEMERAEKLANDIVMQNLPISARVYDESEIKNLPLRKIPDREGTFRIVRIGDYDTNACGGTHCRHTGEVGPIKIIGTEKLRAHFRISFLCGTAALDDYRGKHRIATSLAAQLTCHFKDLPDKISRLTADNQELRRSLALRDKRLFECDLAGIIDDAPEFAGIKILIRHFAAADFNLVKEYAMTAAARATAVVLFSTDNKLLIARSEGVDLRADDLAREFIDGFGGRGGGSATLAQVGHIPEDELSDFVDTFAKTIGEKLAI